MGIRSIVREKMQTAKFHSMLALFMKRATSTESQRMARLVGKVDHNEEEFLLQSQKQFNELLAYQGEDRLDVLVIKKLRIKADTDHGIEGVSVEELVIVCCMGAYELVMYAGELLLKL